MKKAIKIGAWNVRGTNQEGELQIIVEQMAKQGINIWGKVTQVFEREQQQMKKDTQL